MAALWQREALFARHLVIPPSLPELKEELSRRAQGLTAWQGRWLSNSLGSVITWVNEKKLERPPSHASVQNREPH